jgi:hypothetical protein
MPLYQATKLFRIYEPLLVPGLFQTSEYATVLMRSHIALSQIPDDTAEAVAARIARQRVLRSRDHRFAVVLEEHALRTRIGPAAVLAAQLHQLIESAALPRVSLGIIPQAADRSVMWPEHGFWIFDNKRVQAELVSAQVTVTQPREIALYARAFEHLSNLAVYGKAARALIAEAITAISSGQSGLLKRQ